MDNDAWVFWCTPCKTRHAGECYTRKVVPVTIDPGDLPAGIKPPLPVIGLRFRYETCPVGGTTWKPITAVSEVVSVDVAGGKFGWKYVGYQTVQTGFTAMEVWTSNDTINVGGVATVYRINVVP